MWSLLYLFFILSVSYKYRTDLLIYVLENMEVIRALYKTNINKYHSIYGCPILEDINRNGVHYIKYVFNSNNYIMYLNDDEYNENVVNGRLLPDFPYEIKEIKKNLLNLGIQSSDDIIYAFIRDNDNEIDVTDFCKMLSGPYGNFYSDNPFVLKVKREYYKDDLLRWMGRNSVINCDITYIGSLGDEYYLDS